MAVKLFTLRNVLEDEAEEIRALLEQNSIDFYETPAGNWGMSLPAIWLNDEALFDKATLLIDEYQKARSIRVRAEFDALKKAGKHKTLVDGFKENPVRLIAYLFVILVLIYISTIPYIDFGE